MVCEAVRFNGKDLSPGKKGLLHLKKMMDRCIFRSIIVNRLEPERNLVDALANERAWPKTVYDTQLISLGSEILRMNELNDEDYVGWFANLCRQMVLALIFSIPIFERGNYR
jgi:hypothetical protein